MIEIVLCEDDDKERAWMTEYIKGHVMMENLDMELVMATANPEEVLSHAKTHASGGLYFLDVDLKAEMTGIQLAAQIRKCNPRASIVFITTHAELMSLTFEYAIEAMGYISKGDEEVTKEKIVKYIRHVIKKEHNTEISTEKFIVKVDDVMITEDYEQILSFEIAVKRQSKVVMYTKKRSVEINATLAEIEKMSDKFVRCHRSCVVNVDNIKSVDFIAKIIYLINGDTCEASASGIKMLKKVLGS